MITVEDHEGVKLLTLAHGKVNALDVEFLRAIEDCFDELKAVPPKAVVLTGTASAFSAGVDLARLLVGDQEYASALIAALDATLLAVLKAPFPVVAALNGHAIAGGFVIACACDRRMMAKGRGRVGVPELSVGVPWPTVALEIVRQAFAPNRAQELILLGQTYQAADALELGFVDCLKEPSSLLASAIKLATQLGAINASAYRTAKALLRQPVLDRIAKYAPEWDADIEHKWGSSETKQLIREYFEKTVGRKS